ncbi:Hydantoinase B/oxoprolinase [Aspergillus ellipticus CBS 707.79]|uniref:Hydantoinase B/oxoprolinase n=1 Tax=Aspergillus ellipticus CBS 707.79 TaxID=1448320 RepID=A0A319DIA9_9EURO|nr:Hydantoinase B/oxoprolinase [Aspergillus ellipticus CBS 707.79]
MYGLSGFTLRELGKRISSSCSLVAHASHVPVYLGSMRYAVKYHHDLQKGKLMPGDVLVSNHPDAGGTHLPDITVITPVFEKGGHKVAFYVASRGHHTDIGGFGGTSMPPNSTELWQEGAAIRSFKLIHQEKFDEGGITELLLHHGQCSGCTVASRHISENISDLKAQVAANYKGVDLMQALIGEYTLPVTEQYRKAIESNAEWAVRGYVHKILSLMGPKLTAQDQMDNGSVTNISIKLFPDGSATFDFTGTDCELRNDDIPLNQGYMAPIDVILPKGTFFNPSSGAAVCAASTHTSQRIMDVILRAFRAAAAASHGCMNYLGFSGEGGTDADGKKLDGYAYAFGETICGGSGATAKRSGESGVHTHMTNTRITDPESLEKRYPVILREFAIRPGTSGTGTNRGGDGVVRDTECRRLPLSFSVITERRSIAPYGMNGGGPGERGANYWNMVRMEAGDRCVIHTPGGGGWGPPDMDGRDGFPEEIICYPRASGSVAAYMAAQDSSA